MSPSTRRETISLLAVVALGVDEQGRNQQRLLHHLAACGGCGLGASAITSPAMMALPAAA
jgi:hypothetical protein